MTYNVFSGTLNPTHFTTYFTVMLDVHHAWTPRTHCYVVDQVWKVDSCLCIQVQCQWVNITSHSELRTVSKDIPLVGCKHAHTVVMAIFQMNLGQLSFKSLALLFLKQNLWDNYPDMFAGYKPPLLPTPAVSKQWPNEGKSPTGFILSLFISWLLRDENA